MWRSNKSAPQRWVREQEGQDAQGEKRGTWRLEEAVVNLNPSASELPRLLEPPLLGKKGLTAGILVFHLTCENDRWSVGHGVGGGFARLHCAVYAERNG